MDNYELVDGVYRFAVNGGDSRTTKWAYGISGMVPLLFAGLYFGAGLQSLPIPSPIWVISCLTIVVVVFYWLSKGSKARYIVEIDPQNKNIKATDRLHNIDLWEDAFVPENVYVSNIQVIVSNQVYRYPVLAYGSNQQELIEDGVPNVHRTLLGFGEEEDVKSMCAQLQKTS